MQVHSLSRESILSEMSGVEGKYQTAMSQVASTTDQMTQLEANGEYTSEYTNITCIYACIKRMFLHYVKACIFRIGQLSCLSGLVGRAPDLNSSVQVQIPSGTDR